MGLIWVAISFLFGQQEEIISKLGRDAEDPLPEEDILILENVFQSSSQDIRIQLVQIENLSFLPDSDIDILRKIYDSNSISKWINHKSISDELKTILIWLPHNQIPIQATGNIRQAMIIGDEIRYQLRGTIDIQNYRVGFFMERDPGEDIIADRKSGYFSGTYKYGDWVIGDYQILAGYGLLLWRSMSVKKGLESITVLPRKGKGLQAYRSSNESWNFRGIGVTWKTKLGNWLFSLGRNLRDGSIDSNYTIHTRDDGLHDSEISIAEKENLVESSLIGQWEKLYTNGYIGITSLASNWTTKYSSSIQFDAFSVHGSYKSGTWMTFGEWATGFYSKPGFLWGTQLSSNGIRYLLSVRSYSNGFVASRSNPFSEWAGEDHNEIGLYQGMRIKFGHHKFTLFGDIYRESSSVTLTDFPKAGQEFALRWEWKNPKQYFRFQGKIDMKANEGYNSFTNENIPDSDYRQSLKFASVRSFTKQFSWKIQMNYSKSISDTLTENGVGIESLWTWHTKNVTAVFHWVSTWIDSYDSRVYFWDINLPGEMRSKMFSTNVHSPAVKILYITENNFRIGYRIRSVYETIDLTGGPKIESALIFDINL